MGFVKAPMKGMRDFLPEQMSLRNYVMEQIKDTYSKFGYSQIETPCIENIENLSNKQGGENEKLIFKIMKRGEKLKKEDIEDIDSLVDSGLRYDLTVPLSRYYANNMNQLSYPFKSLQMGNVWRADRPQKGRFRQFMQCDIDILGEKTSLAEIDLITATTTLLNKFELDFKIRINDRRILAAMALSAGFDKSEIDSVFISLDKIDKIGLDGVKEELLNNDYELSKIEKYLKNFEYLDGIKVMDLNKEDIKAYLDESILIDLDNIIYITSSITGSKIEFDPTLVRGMSYYTGPIFEISVDGYPGSVGGGGRYDNMVEKYANVSVPACGFSIGFERLIGILEERNFMEFDFNKKYVYLIDKDISKENLLEIEKEALNERAKGNIIKITYKNKNIKHQIEVFENDGYEVVVKK